CGVGLCYVGVGDRRLASLGKCTCLVEHHHIQSRSFLEGLPTPSYKDPMFRGQTTTDEERGRSSKGDTTRAGHHKNCNRELQRPERFEYPSALHKSSHDNARMERTTYASRLSHCPDTNAEGYR